MRRIKGRSYFMVVASMVLVSSMTVSAAATKSNTDYNSFFLNEGSIVEIPAGQDVAEETTEQLSDGDVSTSEVQEVIPEETGKVVGSTYEGRLNLTTPNAEGQILSNVYVDGISVANMSKQQAIDTIRASSDNYANTVVRFKFEDQTKDVPMSTLGYSTNVEDVVYKAMASGKTGNALKRRKDADELASGKKRVDLSVMPEFDDSSRGSVEASISEFNREPISATVKMLEDSTFEFEPAKNGIAVDVDATMNNLKDKLSGSWDGIVEVDVAYNEAANDIKEDPLAGMTDMLGTFTTKYAGPDAGRMGNIENAMDFINGSVVMPGEEFNVDAKIEPYTEENGYFYAGEYSGGKVVSGLGGGICQVSTTLYNAVLFAELEVVQRANHSLTVGYVKLSMDAAIAGKVKNFRFKNNMETPIYIAGGYSNGYITFAIFGKETRPANRRLEFESKLIETIAPPSEPIETVNPKLAPGERRVTQKAHTGFKAELWKHIYVDDVLVDSVQVNSSTYNATPEYVDVGGEDGGSGDDTTTEAPTTETTETPATTEAPSGGETPPSDEDTGV